MYQRLIQHIGERLQAVFSLRGVTLVAIFYEVNISTVGAVVIFPIRTTQ